MKKIIFFCCFMYVLGFSISGCKKSDEDFQSTIFCTIDKWAHWRDCKPETTIWSLSESYKIVFPYENQIGIKIEAHQTCNGRDESLIILLDSFTVNQVGSIIHFGGINKAAFKYDDKNNNYYTAVNGWVQITALSGVNKEVSGTFNFDAVYTIWENNQLHFDTNKKIKISNGYFNKARICDKKNWGCF